MRTAVKQRAKEETLELLTLEDVSQITRLVEVVSVHPSYFSRREPRRGVDPFVSGLAIGPFGR